MNRRQFLTATSLSALAGCTGPRADVELLNVSYDPTRELYRKVNRLFADHYLARTGLRAKVRQSHGGSGSQARAVIDGIPADVVTLAMEIDIAAVQARGLIGPDWKTGPDGRGSLPYHSTIVFVVRQGNPFGIRGWNDLIEKPGLKVITANPKTGGGAKLALLAAWGAVRKAGGTDADARAFVTEMYKRVPVLDTGARGATVTFARKNIGDVHLTWENEAWLEKRELKDAVEIVYPTWSVCAEPHVALVSANVDKKGTRAAAEEYMRFLYSAAAQAVIAETYFRPGKPADTSPPPAPLESLKLFRATDADVGLGADWDTIQKRYFAEGGLFDQIYQSGR